MYQFFLLLCLLSVSILAYARLNPRIIGGNFATERQFPYQVSLQREGSRHFCGGGIIGERFILTAAHCAIDGLGNLRNFQFKVVADSTDLNNLEKGRSVDVEKIYVLKSFRPLELKNDIAVFKLTQDIGLNNDLSKLDLPRDHRSYVGQTAKFAGYGWNKIQHWRNGTSDHILRYLNVNIISNEKCRHQWSIFESDIRQRIYDSNICGQAIPQRKGGMAGACKGDSGGPLVIDNTVVGVASRAGSSLCIEKALAARYTRVSNFVGFVNDVLNGVETDDMAIYYVAGTDDTEYAIAFPEDQNIILQNYDEVDIK